MFTVGSIKQLLKTEIFIFLLFLSELSINPGTNVALCREHRKRLTSNHDSFSLTQITPRHHNLFQTQSLCIAAKQVFNSPGAGLDLSPRQLQTWHRLPKQAVLFRSAFLPPPCHLFLPAFVLYAALAMVLFG